MKWETVEIQEVDGERLFTKKWVVVNTDGSWWRIVAHCRDFYMADQIARALNKAEEF